MDESHFGRRNKGKPVRGLESKVQVFEILERNGKVYVNGIMGFWIYAKNKTCKFHGVSSKAIPLYIKELEVKYNSRDGEIFGIVLEKLSGILRVTL